ncbi:MAG: flagellar assembly protein FliW, partial [Chloroflexota bacterium]
DAAALQACSAADLLVLAVVNLPEGEPATANLLSPLIINVRAGLGKQVLLAGSGYSIHYRFLKGDQAGEAPA